MPKIRGTNLLNKTIGDFDIIGYCFKIDHRKTNKLYWQCRCYKCGHEKLADSRDLLKRGAGNCIYCMDRPHLKESWTKERRDKVRQKAKNTILDNKSDLYKIYYSYQGSAKTRGLLFDINIEDFEKLILKNCHYCGKPPSRRKLFKIHEDIITIYNGVDRVDNTIGYLIENCVPCCTMCNMMKNKYSLEHFMDHITSIYEFYIMKNNI